MKSATRQFFGLQTCGFIDALRALRYKEARDRREKLAQELKNEERYDERHGGAAFVFHQSQLIVVWYRLLDHKICCSDMSAFRTSQPDLRCILLNLNKHTLFLTT